MATWWLHLLRLLAQEILEIDQGEDPQLHLPLKATKFPPFMNVI